MNGDLFAFDSLSRTRGAAHRQYEADSFASAAASLASSNGSPWAAYDADFYTAKATHVTAVAGAAKANAVAQASAQKAAEIAQTNAETTWRNANATSVGTLNTSIAGAHLGFATDHRPLMPLRVATNSIYRRSFDRRTSTASIP